MPSDGRSATPGGSAPEEPALLRTIVDNTFDLIAVLDTDGTLIFTGDAHRTLGYAPDEMEGTSVFDFVHPEDRSVLESLVRQAVHTDTPLREEIRARNADGTYTWVETLARTIEHQGRHYVLCDTRDISERKRMEEQLKESAALLKTVVENTFDLVAVTDSEGTVIFAAHSYRLVGYEPSELVGTSVFDVLHADHRDEAVRMCRRVVETGEPQRMEHRTLTAAGEWTWLETTAQLIDYYDEKRVLLNTRNITEWKDVELTDKRRIDEQAALLKESHHRIKNNLNTVASLLSLQADTVQASEAADALAQARRRVRAMATLYDTLHRSVSFQHMPLSDYLNPLIDEIVGVLTISTAVVVEKDIAVVQLSPKQLSTLGIITNELLTNAMRHAFAGRPDGHIRVEATHLNRQLTLTVADDGNGMPESIDPSSPDSFGLTLVRVLTEQMGGVLGVERDKGTQFEITFPIAGEAAQP